VVCLASRKKDKPVHAGEVVKVEAVPVLRMLFSNTPGGWRIMEDRPRKTGTESESPGRYELSALRKGEYRLTFSRPGYASIEREVVLAADDSEVDDLDVTLLKGDTIAGQVVDAQGLEVKGALVRALHRYVEPNPRHWTTTAQVPHRPIGVGNEGRFQFNQLYEGMYTFEVTAEGYEPVTVKAVAPGTTDLKVVLESKAAKK
jgi:hypothetical protein